MPILQEWYIIYAPTILFILMIVLAALGGFLKGLRKSTISLIHTIIAFAIVAIIFVVYFNQKNYDQTTINLINSFGFNLQQTLGVDSSCDTFAKIIEAYLNNLPSNQQILGVAAANLVPYVAVIAEMALRIVMAIVLYVVYIVIRILLFIIYFIFYPERRYKKKKNELYDNKMAVTPYSKRRLGGFIVGAVHGLIAAVVYISFLGSLIFILTGGVSTKVTVSEEQTFGNENYDTIVDVYSLLRDYNSTGVLGALNSIKNSDNVPFYFILVDTIAKGRLTDESLNVDEDIYLREELTGYTNFLNGMVDLLLKYSDKVDFTNTDQNSMINAVTTLMSDSEFVADFNQFIEGYESPKWTTNLCISLIDSVVSDFDGYSESLASAGLDSKSIGLLKVALTGENSVKPSEIVTADDAKTMVKVVIDCISYVPDLTSSTATQETKVKSAISCLKKIEPQIESLSCFTATTTRTKMNALMGDVVTYLCNTYVTNFDLSNLDLGNMNLDWMGELDNLGDLIVCCADLVGQLDFSNMQSSALNLFKTTNSNYTNNKTNLNKIAKLVGDSEFLSTVLQANGVYNAVEKTLSGFVGTTISIPHDIVWNNTYDASGALVKKGEVEVLVSLLFEMASNGIDGVIGNGSTQTKITAVIDCLSVKNADNQSIVDRITDSSLIYYVVSSAFMNMNMGSFSLSVPDSVIVDHTYNGVTYEMISETEIKALFGSLQTLLANADGIDFDTVGSNPGQLISLVSNDDVLDAMFNSEILECTMVEFLYDTLENTGDTIYIPSALVLTDTDKSNMTNWINNKDGNTVVKGELRKVIDGVLALDILTGLTDGSDTSNLVSMDLIKNMTEEEFNTVTSSDVLYYTICKTLTTLDLGEMSVVIPSSVLGTPDVKAANRRSASGSSVSPIDRTELWKMISGAKTLFTGDSFDIANITANIDSIIASDILHATAVNYIIKLMNDNTSDLLVIPTAYKDAGQLETLKGDFDTNLWKTSGELSKVVKSVDLVGIDIGNVSNVDVSSLDVFNLDQIDTESSKTKMAIVCESAILWATISNTVITNSDTIIVPTNAYDSTETTNIKVTELVNVIKALKVFNITDLSNLNSDSFTMNTIFGDHFDDNVLTLLTSLIIEATAADKIYSQAHDSTEVVIPTKYVVTDLDKSNLVNWESERDANDEIVVVSGKRSYGEVGKLLYSINELGLGDTLASGSTIDFTPDSILGEDIDAAVVTNSDVIWATCSSKLVSSDSLVVTDLAIEVTPADFGTMTLIKKSEVADLLVAAKSIGLTTIETTPSVTELFTGDFSAKINKILSSYIFEATVADYVIDQLASSVTIISTLQFDIVDFTQIVDTSTSNIANWLSTRNADGTVTSDGYKELGNLLVAANELGIGASLDTEDGMSISANSFLGSSITDAVAYTRTNTVLKSEVFRYTTSKTITESSYIIVPSVCYSPLVGTDQAILANETVNLVMSLRKMGISDFTSGSLSSSNVNNSIFKSDYEYKSVIMLASVSNIVYSSFGYLSTASKDTTYSETGLTVLKFTEVYQLLTDFDTLGINFASPSISTSVISTLATISSDYVQNTMSDTSWLYLATSSVTEDAIELASGTKTYETSLDLCKGTFAANIFLTRESIAQLCA